MAHIIPLLHVAPVAGSDQTRTNYGLHDVDYPLHDWTATVTRCGRICWNRRKINLSTVFAGQDVGVRQVSDRIWLVSFMDNDLRYFDDEACRLEPIANAFSPRVLPHPSRAEEGQSAHQS